MENRFKKLVEIVNEDIRKRKPTLSQLLSKLTEETGELAKEVNRLTGRKNMNFLTQEEVMSSILEEGIDTIQCVLAIFILLDIRWEDVLITFDDKNNAYRQYLIKTNPVPDPASKLIDLIKTVAAKELKSYEAEVQGASEHNNSVGVGIHFDYMPLPAKPEWIDKVNEIIKDLELHEKRHQ